MDTRGIYDFFLKNLKKSEIFLKAKLHFWSLNYLGSIGLVP